MSEFKGTPGPYFRVGTAVYALQHAGWRKGEEQFCNRIYANIQRGPACPEEEAEAVARLFQAAPDLLEALRRCKFDSLNMSLDDMAFCRAAIAKATGS